MIDWEAVERGVMSRLEPFQRRTVEWAFANLYPIDGSEGSRRFLVADEVGLGKTMVARGVLAKTLRHLQGRVKRIDVVYVCSNANIASQNLDRLWIDEIGGAGVRSHGRLTLMPLVPRRSDGGDAAPAALQARGINFMSLTPATSLDVAGDVGQSLERIVLLLLLEGQVDGVSDRQMLNLFSSRMATENFETQFNRVCQANDIDLTLKDAFLRSLAQTMPDFADQFRALAPFFKKRKKYRGLNPANRQAAELIGRLRSVLASVCIEAVEPDLVILDEFQRFTHLLNEKNEEAKLAQQLFRYGRDGHHARVLLLSATPYRMCATSEDETDTLHFEEFLATVEFLYDGDASALAELKARLAEFNLLLRTAAPDTLPDLVDKRRSIENLLSRVMARTDRVPATSDRDAMIKMPSWALETSPQDLVSYVNLSRVAAALKQPDLVEYWRSAPWPLSFLSGYKLRDQLGDELRKGDPSFLSLLQASGLFMPADAAESLVPANARTRELASGLLDAGMHKLLWIPPSLPCYVPGGPYADVGEGARTKRLLFSSWRMVPRAVSTAVDRAFSEAISALHAARREEAGAVAEQHQSESDFALGYPSAKLALSIVPALLAHEIAAKGGEPTFEQVADLAARFLEADIQSVVARHGNAEAASDSDWYWMAPLLMDVEPVFEDGNEIDVAVDWLLGEDERDLSVSERRCRLDRAE